MVRKNSLMHQFVTAHTVLCRKSTLFVIKAGRIVYARCQEFRVNFKKFLYLCLYIVFHVFLGDIQKI